MVGWFWTKDKNVGDNNNKAHHLSLSTMREKGYDDGDDDDYDKHDDKHDDNYD